MPSCVTSVFSDWKDFEAALGKEGVLGLLVTGGGQFKARLTQVTLHGLHLSAAEEPLPRVAFVAVPTDMLLVSLPIGDRPAPIWGGITMQAGEFVTLGPGERVHARTDGPSRWGCICVPGEGLARYGRALVGTTFAVPLDLCRWRPRPADGRHLRHLHGAAIRMAVARPETLVDAEVARGLQQQLIHALVECLSAGSADKDTLAARRHRNLAVRLEGLLQSQPDRNPRMAEISATLGVSDRTLRFICEQQLGVSPKSYVLLRRMQLVHRTLRHGGPDMMTVSEVAQRYGFRQLGRFAADYRNVFGELPSATLARAHLEA